MFFVKKGKYESLKDEYESLLDLQTKTENKKLQLESKCEILVNKIKEYEDSSYKLLNKNQKLKAAKGGLTKENNKIRRQNKDLIKENHELMRQIDDANIKFIESTNLIDTLTKHNKKMSEEKTKLQKIVENLNQELQQKK